jgi:hypothetical protein
MSCLILENGNIGICVKMVKYGLGKDSDAATARFSYGMTNEDVAFASICSWRRLGSAWMACSGVQYRLRA